MASDGDRRNSRRAKKIDRHSKEGPVKAQNGVASISLLEDIRVSYYGQPTPLNQVATISAPDSRTITIQPWDASSIGGDREGHPEIGPGRKPYVRRQDHPPRFPEADRGAQERTDEAWRKDAGDRESGHAQCEKRANEKLKKMEKEKALSKDEAFKLQEEVQKTTDKYIGQAEAIYAEKEKEILEI